MKKDQTINKSISNIFFPAWPRILIGSSGEIKNGLAFVSNCQGMIFEYSLQKT
jgi:hypothetical protein